MKAKRQNKKKLLGLGLDQNDEHVRYTKGPNFILFGGSADTHNQMQEKAIKFNEKLKKRGKTLDEINPEEFHEIGEEIGLQPLPKQKPFSRQ